jgi:polyisoprenyl-phosphate glycosyltransferase
MTDMREIKINDVDVNKDHPFISIVFSFFNEENVLIELIKRVRTVMKPEIEKGIISGYEMIFVNDASTDHSKDILIGESDSERDLLIVDMSRNFGVSECVMVGFKIAKGDAVIYMDCDLQDPPELIPEMVNKWQADIDVEVVYTTRKKRKGESLAKLSLTKFGYRLINSLGDIDLPVDSGDVKLLSRRAVKHILILKEQRPYLRGMVSWIGFKQAQIFYDRDGRLDGRENTKFPVFSKRVIYGYLDRALISFSDAPLKIMLLIGLFVSIIAMGYIGVIITQKILGLHEPGWPALMASILLLGGVQLSVLGIIGLYIGGIFTHVKGRPLSVVNSVLGTNERVSEIKLDDLNSS